MLPVRTPPAFIPSPAYVALPAVKAVGVGGAAIATAVALPLKLPVLIAAGGAFVVGVGIYKLAEFLAQEWGYFNGKAPIGGAIKTADGVPIRWTGPGGAEGGQYDVTMNWTITYSKTSPAEGLEPEVEVFPLVRRGVGGPFDGAFTAISATPDTKGQWKWGLEGEAFGLPQPLWPQNFERYYRISESPLEIEVEEVVAPPVPKPNPYPAYYPATTPSTNPKAVPTPEVQPQYPSPARVPDADPIPAPGPKPEPAPAPLPQRVPAPSPAPNPTIPEAEPLPNDGTAPAPKALPPVVTDKDQHFIGDVPVGGPAVGPATMRQIQKELGRIEQKTAMIIQPNGPGGGTINEILEALIAALLSLLPGFDYSLTEKCEPCGDDEQCPAPVYSEKLADGETAGLQGLAYRMDALARLVDGQLGARQVTCNSSPPELEGSWVTIRFESDAPSEMGNRPLRKLFRYRTVSGKSLGQLADYWHAFRWNAGPVCVIHKGASWGTPQCWAESADEGKRVIRFAAAESGFNPDEVGQWQISFSGNPRIGQRGSMRVKLVEGFPAVTARDGSDGLPEVAQPLN